jgi:hypothetical protein
VGTAYESVDFGGPIVDGGMYGDAFVLMLSP